MIVKYRSEIWLFRVLETVDITGQFIRYTHLVPGGTPRFLQNSLIFVRHGLYKSEMFQSDVGHG